MTLLLCIIFLHSRFPKKEPISLDSIFKVKRYEESNIQYWYIVDPRKKQLLLRVHEKISELRGWIVMHLYKIQTLDKPKANGVLFRQGKLRKNISIGK